MKTEKGKKDVLDIKGDMRIVMRLLSLYDACLKNAESLLSEADLLFKNGYYLRAFALAHIQLRDVVDYHDKIELVTLVIPEK
jgi:hypothetical protein